MLRILAFLTLFSSSFASLEMHQPDFIHRPFHTGITKDQDLHPLDPLTPAEFQIAVDMIETSKMDPSIVYIYSYVTLFEPPKSVLLPFFLDDMPPPPDIYDRKAFLVLIDNSTKFIFEAVLNLKTKHIESFMKIDNVQAPLSPNDLLIPETAIVLANDSVQARCAALGYPHMNLVAADAWSIGYVDDIPEFKGRRLIQFYFFGKNFALDNQFAHPLDFVAVVDMDIGQVIAIEDLPTHNSFSTDNTGNTAPKTESNYDYHLRGGASFLRKDDKPITQELPEGPSYKVKGNEVTWQKWKMRVGFNGREGLVLYNVNYDDNGTKRPILYRASVTEMFIPYGDPRPPYHRKGVFDMGDYGLGFMTNRQSPMEDTISPFTTFLSFALHNISGLPVPYDNAISIYEEDAGLLWKHEDYRNGKGALARSHRLVISTLATVGNYDYLFSWNFYQDGSIHFLAQLTGSLSTTMIVPWATRSGFGTPVAEQVNAQYHQHFFTVRLDTEIDGTANSVSTVDIQPVNDAALSPKNPTGQGFTINETILHTAGEGRTKISPLSGRTWTISNPSKLNSANKKPVAWKLMPTNSPPLLMKEDSKLRPKAAYLDYDVWVTVFKDDQKYPGGYYLNNSGLPVWVGDDPDASIEGNDIVVWHNFGPTHIPRVEDYPVMPVESTGFWLKPYNFFSENPGIDVPPPT